jgi:cell division protein ZapA
MEEEIISIKIGGLEYKLQCPIEEQAHLLEAAEKLDKKIKSTKRKLKTLPMERISVLAALDISSDLVKLQSQGAEVIESIEQPESPKEETKKELQSSQTEEADIPEDEDEDLNFKLVSEISELSKL